jgi:hypothetical protein
MPPAIYEHVHVQPTKEQRLISDQHIITWRLVTTPADTPWKFGQPGPVRSKKYAQLPGCMCPIKAPYVPLNFLSKLNLITEH